VLDRRIGVASSPERRHDTIGLMLVIVISIEPSGERSGTYAHATLSASGAIEISLNIHTMIDL
jgi:hypothetical protein